jgi:hypothetical protein
VSALELLDERDEQPAFTLRIVYAYLCNLLTSGSGTIDKSRQRDDNSNRRRIDLQIISNKKLSTASKDLPYPYIDACRAWTYMYKI